MPQFTDKTRSKSGKGFTRYQYTTKDIAEVTGRAIGTIRNDQVSGSLVIEDLISVARYITKHTR